MTVKSVFPVAALVLALVLLSRSQVRAAPPSPELQGRLIHAVVQNQFETVKTLLEQGGDPNARVEPGQEDAWIRQGRTSDDPAPPLIVLACRFGSPESKVVQLLLAKGANVNIADRNGVTPLMAASELDWDPSIALLLEGGAKINAKDRDGKTALMYAMGNRGLGAAAKLMEKGADINASDKAGRTPLMYAITQAASDPIRLYGDDPAKKEKESKVRYLELIAFLIAQKADVNAKDAAGNTPLKLAGVQKRPEIVQMLRQAGAKD